MKFKHLFLSITILLTSFLSSSDLQENKKALLCSGKWYMNNVLNGEVRMKAPDNSWMIFHKDGKYNASGNVKEEKGLWKFSKNKDSILLNIDQTINIAFRINKLTPKELEIYFADNTQDVTISLSKEK